MSNQSHFAYSQSGLDIQRSQMDRSSTYKTTFNAGKLVPVYLDEVLPGDTFDMNVNVLARMSTPIFPVMDNAYMDIFWFFVPNRLVWSHWKNFCGESDSPWTSNTTYSVPQIPIVSGSPGSLLDYFGLPLNALEGAPTINALPFRGYRLIWNEWFRDQNLQEPLLVNTGDSETDMTLYQPCSVNKFHDYFTSCLPAPQKGPSTLIPGLQTSVLPVSTVSNRMVVGQHPALSFANTQSGGLIGDGNTFIYRSQFSTNANSGAASGTGLYPTNLAVQLDADMIGTINQLRQAFQVQKLLERDARGGTRYREMVYAHFGVTIPDSTVQVPEYLGGERFVLNMEQVLQNSATEDNTTPIGTVSAYSKTIHNGGHFVKSFTEHGFLFGLACVRTNQSYSQGYDKLWTRKNRFDYYYPALAHIGEQPVFSREIFADGSDNVFGYQEPWAEYRYKPSRVTSFFRPEVSGSLSSWHYGDYYTEAPTLSSAWITASDSPLKRTLAVQSTDPDQILADFYFDLKCTRAMPMYSIPGLVDHF